MQQPELSVKEIIEEIQSSLSKIEKKHSKELKKIKDLIIDIDEKINSVAEKIQEFEIIIDAADFIEDNMHEQEEYDNRWNSYEDEIVDDYYDEDDYDMDN